MRTAVLCQYGAEDSLNFEKNAPEPKLLEEWDIIIRTKCCAISTTDVFVREGCVPGVRTKEVLPSPPFNMGYEVSGVVSTVGPEVTRFKPGDEVVGFLPADSRYGGYGEWCAGNNMFFVRKPGNISFEDAAASIAAGVRAFSALHYQLKAVAGESILVMNGASGMNHISVQLAAALGLRVVVTCNTSEEMNYLQDLPVDIARIVDLSSDSLVESVLTETGGLGVDCIIEDLPDSVEDLVLREQLCDILAMHGRWCCGTPGVELNPEDASRLWFKCASMSFLNEQAWVMASTVQGRLIHVLEGVMDRLVKGKMVVKVSKKYPLEKVREAHRQVRSTAVGRIVLVHQ